MPGGWRHYYVDGLATHNGARLLKPSVPAAVPATGGNWPHPFEAVEPHLVRLHPLAPARTRLSCLTIELLLKSQSTNTKSH